jgi:hypothetical protein
MTSGTTRRVIQAHWQLANTRQWNAFARLLAPDLAYHVPQTRERIHSGAGYLDLFVTWPGAWTADIEALLCDDQQAVCRVAFRVGDEVMTGISFFVLSSQGLIAEVTDYWPEPYEPPPRASRHLVRY